MKNKKLQLIILLLLAIISSISISVQALNSNNAIGFDSNENKSGSTNKSSTSLLYSQSDIDANYRVSQVFDGILTSFTSEAIDDFIIPQGGIWNITELEIFGSGSNYQSLAVHVRFFNDNNGTPEDIPFESFENLTTLTNTDAELYISLPPGGISLNEGHYWVSVQVATASSIAGQWFWHCNPDVYHDIAHWRNPDDGFNTGATEWTPNSEFYIVDYDLAFSLYGNDNTPDIPLNNYSVILGFLLIFAFAMYKLRV